MKGLSQILDRISKTRPVLSGLMHTEHRRRRTALPASPADRAGLTPREGGESAAPLPGGWTSNGRRMRPRTAGGIQAAREGRCADQSFPGGSEVKVSACNAGDPGLIPGSGRFPWRRKWQPTPVLLPGESHGGRSLVGYSPWGHKELDTTE